MTIFLQATFEGLALGAVYSLVAIGLVLIYKAMDVLSFAQPALAVVGAGIISALAVDRDKFLGSLYSCSNYDWYYRDPIRKNIFKANGW